MRQRLRFFIVVLLLMFAKENFSQKTVQNIFFEPYNSSFFKTNQSVYERIKNKPTFLFESNNCVLNKNSLLNNPNITLDSRYINGILILSSGVLCRIEYKFQKTTLIPLRLRLGSLDYTNYLEQKPNAVKPSY